MLKLERASSDKQISVIVRDKEPFFTRPFLGALTIAISFHLFLVILFNVTPIKIRWSLPSAQPIYVEADLVSKENSAIAAIQQEAKFRLSFLETKPSLPIVAESPHFSFIRQMEYRERDLTSNPFIQMEKEIYQPNFNPEKIPAFQPISLVVSGVLANKRILAHGYQDKGLPALPKSAREKWFRTLFSVLLEESSGRIFWKDPQQKTDIPILDKLAEKILEELRFQPDPSGLFSSGEIEIHFRFFE